MTDEKKPLIIKGPRTQKQKEERKLYTIISCCAGAIFLIALIFPLMSNGGQKPSDMAYSSFSAPDLADQYIDDESEKILLEMNNYSDIPQQKVAGGIFSEKSKEERQKSDATKGLPSAPDEEYKKAYSKANARRTARISRAASSGGRTATTMGSMKTGSMASVSGASSGVSASIWTSEDKKKQQAGAKTGSTLGSLGTQQLTASIGNKGRSNSFIKAAEKSAEAAKSENYDTAGQLAAEAFTNEGLKAEDEDLTEGMDKFAENFDSEKLGKALNNDALTDLKNEMDKEKDKADKEEVDPCKSKDNATRRACQRDELLLDIFGKLTDTALSIVETLATKGKKGEGEELTPEQITAMDKELKTIEKGKASRNLYKQRCRSLRGYHRYMANRANDAFTPCH